MMLFSSYFLFLILLHNCIVSTDAVLTDFFVFSDDFFDSGAILYVGKFFLNIFYDFWF